MRDYYVKNGLVALGGILLSALAVGLLVSFVQVLALEKLPLILPLSTVREISLQDWTRVFAGCQGWVILCSLLLALAWHVYALVNSGREGDDRVLWVILAVVGIAAAFFLAYQLLLPASKGRVLAIGLTLFNGALAYWLATAPFTPPTHKYDPYLAAALRRKAVKA